MLWLARVPYHINMGYFHYSQYGTVHQEWDPQRQGKNNIYQGTGGEVRHGARPTKHILIEFEIRWKFKTL